MLAMVNTWAQTSKIVGECTITFSITLENSHGPATKTLFIKGKKTRSEVSSNEFNQTTIYDNNTGAAVIMKEVGGELYLSELDAKKWKEKNAQWEGLTMKLTNETKTILGYVCKKAVATTKAGKKFTLYYSTVLTPSASENPYQFKNINGLVLEYESQTSDGKNISFSATNVDLSPVPAAKFIIPTSGYRKL